MEVFNKVPSKNIEKLYKLAVDAIEDRGFKANLDGNTLSIIDKLTLELHADLKNISKLSNGVDIIDGASIEFASLIVKMIESRGIKGNWYYSHKTIGENSFPYATDSMVIFPMAWVKKRILEGQKHSVLQKFNEIFPKLEG